MELGIGSRRFDYGIEAMYVTRSGGTNTIIDEDKEQKLM